MNRYNDSDEYISIKNICSDIRRVSIKEKSDMNYFINKKIKYLDNYYIKICNSNKDNPRNIRIRCLIENSVRKAVKKENLNKVIEHYRKLDLKDFDKISQISFYLKYTNKKIEASMNKYFIILKKLNILCGEFKRFVMIYLIFDYYNFDINIFEKLIISDVEKESLLYLLNNNKMPFSELNFDCSLIKVIRCIENYMLLIDIVIYDEDILKKVVKIKNSSIKLSKSLKCDEAFELLVTNKIKCYRENNVTKKDIYFSKKFDFNINVIQNTIFITSKLDKWYLDVDKKNNECILFHNNDGYDDEFHHQKTFKHTNLYRIFKYIKEHDDYCLNGFQKKIKA